MKLRTLSFLALGIAIVAAGAWWFTLRATQAERITSLTSDEQNAQLQATVRQAQEHEAGQALHELQAALEGARSELVTLEQSIPTTIDFTPLMLLINNLTDTHLLQHDGIEETSKEQLTPTVYGVNYELNTTGSFNDQMNFISDLQAQPRLLVVRSIKMTSRTGATPNEPLISLSIDLQTFTRGVIPEPAEPNKE